MLTEPLARWILTGCAVAVAASGLIALGWLYDIATSLGRIAAELRDRNVFRDNPPDRGDAGYGRGNDRRRYGRRNRE